MDLYLLNMFKLQPKLSSSLSAFTDHAKDQTQRADAPEGPAAYSDLS